MSNKTALSIGLVASVFVFAVGYRFSNSNPGQDNATTVAAGSSASVAGGRSIDAAENADRPYRQRDSKAAKQNISVETTAVTQVESRPQMDGRDDVAQDSPYRQYELDVQKNLPPPAWFYTTRNVYAEVAAADPTAVIREVACGDTACRVEVRHENAKARDRFATSISGPFDLARGVKRSDTSESGVEATQLANGMDASTEVATSSAVNVATAYDYPEDDPTATVVYLLKTESPEEMIAKLQAKMQEKTHE